MPPGHCVAWVVLLQCLCVSSATLLQGASDLISWIPRVSGRLDHYELAGLHEGDILLDHRTTGFQNNAVEKNAVADDDFLWPEGIVYYEFSPEYSLFPMEKMIITYVMNDMEKHSCITFKQRTTETDYVKIIYDTYKCYSSVGRVGGEQVLSLGLFCIALWDKGNVYHELLHALGFHHEHTRPDRDEHITIHWDNIKSHMKSNFKKRKPGVADTLNLPYDIRSVMHYNPYAFSKTFVLFPTLESKERGIFFYTSRSPSKLDYAKLNRLYRCPQKIERRKARKRSSTLFNNYFRTQRNELPPSESRRRLQNEGFSIYGFLKSLFPSYKMSESQIFQYSGASKKNEQTAWYNNIF